MNLKQLARKQSQMDAAWLASLGRDHAQRVNSINAMYEERRATLTGMAFFSLDLKGRAVMQQHLYDRASAHYFRGQQEPSRNG